MPNIADTEYRIKGSQKTMETIKPLLKEGVELRSILENLNIDTTDVYARGEIFDVKDFGDFVSVCAETAWSEQLDFINALKDHFKDDTEFEIQWRCEESGCEYFVSNVEGAFYGEYYLDAFSEITYYKTFEQMRDDLDEIIGMSMLFTDDDNHEQVFQTNSFDILKEWCDDFNKRHDNDDYIYVHKFSIVKD